MISRNKREGKFLGKIDGFFMRSDSIDGVWSHRFEPINRRQWKLTIIRYKHSDFDEPTEDF